MQKFEHTRENTKILLLKFSNNMCTAIFFTKKKPEVGDLFKTWEAGEINFKYTYRIAKIIKQEDAKARTIKTLKKTEQGFKYIISKDQSAHHKVERKNALMTIELELLNKRLKNGIISNELLEGIEVPNF